MSKLIYISSPYSAQPGEEDVAESVRKTRYNQVSTFIARMYYIHPDEAFYSPIAHWHPIAVRQSLPTDAQFWKKQNTIMITKCDEVWVLCLPKWMHSVGVTMEITIATGLGKPVEYIIIDDKETP